MKICSKCKIEKSVEEFHKNKAVLCGYTSSCKKCQKEYDKQRYDANKEQENTRCREYKRKNKDKVKIVAVRYWKNRYETDINFRLAHLLRTRIGKVIIRNQKVGSAVKDLGCSMPELKEHLEKQWQPGMTWDNWGRGKEKETWHIDHIKPLTRFDLTDRQQFLEACHYTNLQPLWAEDNI